jgi:phosphoadenosine phosphosulfate reductase
MDASGLEKLKLGQDMDARSATEVVGWAAQTFKKDLVFSCGFTADDMVLLDMLTRIGAQPKIVVVDSCRMMPETYDFIDVVLDRYHLKLSFFFPDTKALAAYLKENAPNAMRHDRKLRLSCCEIRRHEPLRRAIAGHKAWMAGLRRSQGETRKSVAKVALDPVHKGHVKICPLADWSWEQVWTYAKEHGVPMQPLYEQGYMSIGCAPCTRPSQSGDERAGRWWWEPSSQREDGVHVIF